MDRLQREHVHKIGQFIFVGFVAEFSQVQAITFDLENDTRLSRLSINFRGSDGGFVRHLCDGVQKRFNVTGNIFVKNKKGH